MVNPFLGSPIDYDDIASKVLTEEYEQQWRLWIEDSPVLNDEDKVRLTLKEQIIAYYIQSNTIRQTDNGSERLRLSSFLAITQMSKETYYKFFRSRYCQKAYQCNPSRKSLLILCVMYGIDTYTSVYLMIRYGHSVNGDSPEDKACQKALTTYASTTVRRHDTTITYDTRSTVIGAIYREYGLANPFRMRNKKDE